MKEKLLGVAAVVLGIAAMHGQAYVSLGGGYGFQPNQRVVGRGTTNIAAVDNLKESYGEGHQVQLRGEYSFTKRLGVELALGCLHDGDIATNKNQVLDMTAHGRAFGTLLSAVFNITDNLYVRAGAVTRIGGKTESITKLNANLPLCVFNPLASPTDVVNMRVDFQTNFHGKILFGFIGGVGYRFNVTDKISLFVEGECLSINAPHKTSKLESFSASRTIDGTTTELKLQKFKGYMEMLKRAPPPPQTEGLRQLANQISPLLEDEYSWEGEGAPDVPYSFIGFHFGVIYKL